VVSAKCQNQNFGRPVTHNRASELNEMVQNRIIGSYESYL
jgi:hypothetical protein